MFLVFTVTPTPTCARACLLTLFLLGGYRLFGVVLGFDSRELARELVHCNDLRSRPSSTKFPSLPFRSHSNTMFHPTPPRCWVLWLLRPLLNRFERRLRLPSPPYEEWAHPKSSEDSATFKSSVKMSRPIIKSRVISKSKKFPKIVIRNVPIP